MTLSRVETLSNGTREREREHGKYTCLYPNVFVVDVKFEIQISNFKYANWHCYYGSDYTDSFITRNVDRAAELFKACIDELSCNTTDEQYVAYQRAVGVAIGNEYLCSAAARPGIHNTHVI